MTKSQRPTDPTFPSSSVTVSRTPSSPPEEARRSIRLTVKMPSSKLREVTTNAQERRHHNIFTDPVIITGPRNSRSKRKIVEVDTDEEEDYELGDDNAEQSLDVEEEDESDADADAVGDIDIDESDEVVSRPTVTVTPAAAARVRNADAKTVSTGDDDDDDDDDELSELGSEDEATGSGVGDDEVEEEDEGEEEDEEEQDETKDEEDELSESEMGTPARGGTPDLSRMTKRQRGRHELGGDFLQLPMEPQIKKHLTAEEHAMRRAEMARRRKNLSEKRNEEEKMDTINKLLKKQAPKRRGKISAAETAGEGTPRIQESQEPQKRDPTMIRYVSDRNGGRLGMPEELTGNPAGGIINGSGSRGMKLVEEI